ncbi:MAG: DUF1800 domain-containing protein [Gemmataceae bacterium]
MTTDWWEPYAPDPATPWTLRRVVHLHRRAGFAATWAELQRDLADGPDKSAARLAAGKAVETAPAEFAQTAELLADSAVAAGEIDRLKAWWFYRMLFGPDPLGERLTLLWHDHFATADSKVRNPALMRRQNDTLRTHARGRFGVLLDAAVREPALLVYLDAPANRKGHPNENLGRELMELFTLGVGHYSEADVKDAARALTGWSVEDGKFVESAPRHDTGDKTILGQTGQWTGSDLVTLLAKQPATARRVATKLCRLFFGENAPPPEAVTALADGLREHDLDIGWACGVVLKSRLFFADANLGTRVVGPAEFVVGTARALALFDPAPSTLALADWSARIGQDVFDPPNVGGWPPGRAWLHARSLIARANYATALLTGPNAGRPTAYDPAAAAKAAGFGTGPNDVLTFHHRLLFGTDPTDKQQTVAQMIASPEGQLA